MSESEDSLIELLLEAASKPLDPNTPPSSYMCGLCLENIIGNPEAED